MKQYCLTLYHTLAQKNRHWIGLAKCSSTCFGNISPAFTDGKPLQYYGSFFMYASLVHILAPYWVTFHFWSRRVYPASRRGQVQQKWSYAKPPESVLWERRVTFAMADHQGSMYRNVPFLRAPHVLTARGQPYLPSVPRQKDTSPVLMSIYN